MIDKAQKLAKLAAPAKVVLGDTFDMGCLYNEDDFGPMTADEWDALCDKAERLMTCIKPSYSEIFEWETAVFEADEKGVV